MNKQFLKSHNMKIKNFYCNDSVYLGDYLNFSFEIVIKKQVEQLSIGYIIEYLQENGEYKQQRFCIINNTTLTINTCFDKKQPFRNMTTRSHHCGKHFLTLLLNDHPVLRKKFTLIEF